MALLNNDELIEYHIDTLKPEYLVGDVYLGKTKRFVSGLNACFVDVGHQKDGFLHYHDLGPKILNVQNYLKKTLRGIMLKPDLDSFEIQGDTDKDGKIIDILKPNQNVLVQITKEPISSKGPRLTGEISLAGRFLVLIPFASKISVSQKIEDKEERKRLKGILLKIVPKNFGVIVRTVAENISLQDLQFDLQELQKKWKNLHKNLRKSKAPSKILGEITKSTLILREIFNDQFSQIIVDDKEIYEEVKNYIHQIAPKKLNILKHYDGNLPAFEKYGINKQVKQLFGRVVPINKGAYLIIEHTEALHVIDVNSGNISNKSNSQEENALFVNLIAAKEIARQLKLRDMGGIIVVDFIDMHNLENKKKLFNELKEYMSQDKARHKILPPSKFGLVQITRQRIKSELNIETNEPNPDGSNTKISPPIQIIDELENRIENIKVNKQTKYLTINVHPFVHAYLTKGMISHRSKWAWKYGLKIKVVPYHEYNYLEYRLLNENDKEIKF